MKILVTGGTGYIGSHTCVELIAEGHEVIILDNLYNSRIDVLDKIEQISGVRPKFYEADILDKEGLEKVFAENDFDAVIHFAGYKAVGESVANPLKYYRNNIDSTISLLELMVKYGVKKIVFSSSATVYGDPEELPIKETSKLNVTNPYGATKLYIEGILKDLYISDNEFRIVVLRYFNPVGCDETGLLGEDPNGIPNNLMPYIVKVANKELPCLNIFGNDYDTIDGTGVRDYIHVVDLAKGHLKALEHSLENKSNLYVYNLGSGKGVSVQEIVDAFEKVNNLKLNYQIHERRPADIAVSYADPTKANKELNWYATHTLEDMCKDSYNYAVKTLKLTK